VTLGRHDEDLESDSTRKDWGGGKGTPIKDFQHEAMMVGRGSHIHPQKQNTSIGTKKFVTALKQIIYVILSFPKRSKEKWDQFNLKLGGA